MTTARHPAYYLLRRDIPTDNKHIIATMTTWSELAANLRKLKVLFKQRKREGATQDELRELKEKYWAVKVRLEEYELRYRTVAKALTAKGFTVPALGQEVRWTDCYNGPCEGAVDAPGGDTDDCIEAEQIVVYIPSQGRSVVVDIQHFQEEVPSSADSSDVPVGVLLKKRKRTTLPPVVWERRTPFADPTSTDEDDNVPLLVASKRRKKQEEQADQEEEESVPSPKRRRVGLEDLMQLEFFYGEGGVLVPAA